MVKDWDAVKSLLYELYVIKGLPLDVVRGRLRESSPMFDASIRAYKIKFKQWGWCKYKARTAFLTNRPQRSTISTTNGPIPGILSAQESRYISAHCGIESPSTDIIRPTSPVLQLSLPSLRGEPAREPNNNNNNKHNSLLPYTRTAAWLFLKSLPIWPLAPQETRARGQKNLSLRDHLDTEEAALPADDDAILKALNIRDGAGNQPLHLEILHGDKSAALSLVEMGADISSKNYAGDTPLHIAVLSHRDPHRTEWSLIDKLLHSGADTNIPNCDGVTPFHMTLGNPWIMFYFLKYRADLFSKTKSGRYPVEFFLDELRRHYFQIRHAGHGRYWCGTDISMIKSPISRTENPNIRLKSGQTLLAAFLSIPLFDFPEYREVCLLLCDKVNLNSRGTQGDSPLHCLCQSIPRSGEGMAEANIMIKTLVQRGVDINAISKDGESALTIASKLCPPEVIETLLNLGADPYQRTASNVLPIYRAARNVRPQPEHRCILLLLLLERDQTPRSESSLFTDPMGVTSETQWWNLYRKLYERRSLPNQELLDSVHTLPLDVAYVVSETAFEVLRDRHRGLC
ncbi:hypothetical protein AJ80_00263 [Polytolypa hystricis UAMH7299]|uniref:Clr5 domain-containing protein n=1 Tax=Polytolypa hystricis (strain UAMH7299) TaxID=1447883 RepID=A0A2B7Z4G2_POLH7|nr:hypothetical protein AJ80_00263 [Polytolypa hystricis UAMH7299]